MRALFITSTLIALTACSPTETSQHPPDVTHPDASITDTPTTDTLTTDIPTTDIPTTDTLTTDIPTTDIPTTDIPTTDIPTTDDRPDATPDDVPRCTSRLTLDGPPPDFFWVGQSTDTASLTLHWSGPACNGLSVTSDSPWLAGTLDTSTLHANLVGTHTTGGVHHATLTVRDSTGQPLATAQATLRALGSARPEAPPKVLVIGIDGVRGDAMEGSTLPNLRSLLAHAAASFHVSTQLTGPVVSGPGWTSIFTGVGPDRHRIIGNGNYDQRDRAWPTFFARAHEGLGLRVAIASQWADIPFGIVESTAIDARATGNGRDVSNTMSRWLRESMFDVHFIHFDDVDHAGHTTGFSFTNPAYRAALEGVDTMVRPLFDAIVARPMIENERWLVVVCTDHGGSGTSHGARDHDNRDIPLFVAGPTVQPALPTGLVTQADVHPTVMRFLGVYPPVSWRLESRALGVAYETSCEDHSDNDSDRTTDCDDRDCAPLPMCACHNDDAGSRLGRAVFTGSTTGYTDRLTASCGQGHSPERQVQWTAPRAGTFTFDLTGSQRDLDLVMSARRGGCDGAELACNDNSSGVHPSLRLTLAAGEHIALLIEAKNGATGNFSLNVEALDACPDRDLGMSTGASVATGLVGDSGGTFFASCALSGRDVLLRWRAPQAGVWRLDTMGSDYDTVLALRDGDCTGPELACSDDVGGGNYTSQVLTTLRAGQVVTVVISGFNGRPEGPGTPPAGGSGRWVLNISR